MNVTLPSLPSHPRNADPTPTMWVWTLPPFNTPCRTCSMLLSFLLVRPWCTLSSVTGLPLSYSILKFLDLSSLCYLPLARGWVPIPTSWVSVPCILLPIGLGRLLGRSLSLRTEQALLVCSRWQVLVTTVCPLCLARTASTVLLTMVLVSLGLNFALVVLRRV